MPTDKELMQQALDAMKDGDLTKVKQAIEALRARLAQPEPEPVAWWHDRGDVVDLNVSGHGTPLYFAPPQREWQGLTDEDVKNIVFVERSWADAVRKVEAKLKEKNAA